MTTYHRLRCSLIRALFLTSAFSVGFLPGHIEAQDTTRAASMRAAAVPWREGSVFQVEFMRTRYGATNEYLQHLLVEWGQLLDVAQKRGLILSYKILLGPPANRDDFDVLTWIEFKDPGALDGWDERLRAIEAEVFRVDRPSSRSLVRGEIRDVLGTKIMREIVLR